MLPRLSIGHRLPLLIGLLLLFVIVVYGGAAYREVEQTAIASASIRLSEVSRELEAMLEAQGTRIADAAAALAADPTVVGYVRAPALSRADAVRDVLRREDGDSSLLAVQLFDANGRMLLEWRDSAALGAEEAADPSLQRLVRDRDRAVGPFRETPTGTIFPSLARIPDSGPPEGGGTLVRWHRVSNSAEGRRQVETLIGSNSRLFIGNTAGGGWTDFGSAAEAPPVDVSGSRGMIEYRRPDEGLRLAVALPVDSTPWTLLVEASRQSVVSPAREILPWFAVFGLVLLLAGTAIAWGLSGRITGSVRELAGAAEAISRGDYSRRAIVDRPDELGTLATAFNAMARAVKSAHDALEGKVEELSAMEHRHRSVRERLQHVMASSPSIIYSRPVNGAEAPLSWISENVERLLGYTVDEAMAPGWWADRLHPEDRELLAPAGSYPHPQTDQVREYRFLTRDGEVRWVRDEQRLLPGRDDAVVEIIGALSDITDRVHLEDQFRRSQKLEAVGQLAGGVAHDFNNLLTVIVGAADMALLDMEPPPELAGALREIRAAGDRATHLTRQLLAFSSRTVVERTTFGLNDVVRDVHQMLRRLIGENLTLETRLSKDVGTVAADRGQVEQVLVNLVVNARDATEAGGRILVETRNVTLDEEYVSSHGGTAPGDYVVLEVSDTGTGMTAEVKAHLFEPFFTTKEQGKGTGLGLATSYGIAHRFGGHIEAYSEPGVGTTMKVYLPRASAAESMGAGEVQVPAVGGSETILVVEDDEQVRAITSRILSAQGYKVLEAMDGEAALEVLEDPSREIDLLLTDVVMPRMGGRALAARAAEVRPGLRVLFASGYSDEVIAQNRLVQEGIALIQKPFTRDSLVRKVRDTLDRPLASA